MGLILVFGAALLAVVLLSGIAARTVLSTSLLFLGTGAVFGAGGFGVGDVDVHSPLVVVLADLALFASLYTDGMRAGLPALRRHWRAPTQALLLGMPLTFAGIALLAHLAAGLDWIPAMVTGAVLAPTDPVFAAAIVGRADVPARLRHVLNVESGLNDGLALPVVVVLIAVAGAGGPSLPRVLLDLVGGLMIGIAVPFAFSFVARWSVLEVEARLQPLGPLAVGLIVYGLCHVLDANPYLAAFAAGATLVTAAPGPVASFEVLGELLAEVGKFAALFVFGMLLTPDLFHGVSTGGYLVAGLALILVRPLAMWMSLVGTDLAPGERLAMAWFGPKGFASAVYGLLVLESGIPGAEAVFGLVAVCIALSIGVHSSSDVPIARRFGEPGAQPARDL